MGAFSCSSAVLIGLTVHLVTVEVDLTNGLPKTTIVGLPDSAVSEARERIRSAILNCGFSFPRGRITINLAPATIRKQGAALDLAMAVGILGASGVVEEASVRGLLFYGELALDGTIRPSNGTLLCSSYTREQRLKGIVTSPLAAQEARLAQSANVYTPSSLKDLVTGLRGELKKMSTVGDQKKIIPTAERTLNDFSSIKGQSFAKRALEIAATGGHNVLLSGPPGSGKTLLAKSIPGILPPLTLKEAIEVTKINSVAFGGQERLATLRPFRSPHHSASGAALIGGGTWPKPGEVTLAHRGVLFLDEFPEFSKRTIEQLRQPLEDREVTIARATHSLTFPAQFMLVASMNPCPCGFLYDRSVACKCTPIQVSRYRSKISGPIMDRIDLFVDVPRVETEKLLSTDVPESSCDIQKRVTNARNIQEDRYKKHGYVCNAELTNADLKSYCKMSDEIRDVLHQASRNLHLSARSFNRMLKVSRTIADLSGSRDIIKEHLLEALQYRPQTG